MDSLKESLAEYPYYLRRAMPRSTFDQLEKVYLDHEVIGFGVGANGTPPVTATLEPGYVRACLVLRMHQWLKYGEERYVKVEAKLGSIGPASAPSNGMFDHGDVSNPRPIPRTCGWAGFWRPTVSPANPIPVKPRCRWAITCGACS